MTELNMHKVPGAGNAIVLAMFGTSVESALPGLLNIRDKMVDKFPHTPVRIAFTSKIILDKWKKRSGDPQYCQARPDVPDEILRVRGLVEEITSLREAGYESVVVQAVYMAPAREYEDLRRYVVSLQASEEKRARKTFRHIVVGRPALGNFDTRYPYSEDLKIAAAALASDTAMARQEKAALVYLGHGNKHLQAGNIFDEFAREMNLLYPDTPTIMATLEDTETVDRAIVLLQKHSISKVLLKPFLLAAGGHMVKDMVGKHPESLLSRLQKEGFVLHPVLQGLGEQDDFARIFVRHAAEAAQDAGIELR